MKQQNRSGEYYQTGTGVNQPCQGYEASIEECSAKKDGTCEDQAHVTCKRISQP